MLSSQQHFALSSFFLPSLKSLAVSTPTPELLPPASHISSSQRPLFDKKQTTGKHQTDSLKMNTSIRYSGRRERETTESYRGNEGGQQTQPLTDSLTLSALSRSKVTCRPSSTSSSSSVRVLASARLALTSSDNWGSKARIAACLIAPALFSDKRWSRPYQVCLQRSEGICAVGACLVLVLGGPSISSFFVFSFFSARKMHPKRSSRAHRLSWHALPMTATTQIRGVRF